MNRTKTVIRPQSNFSFRLGELWAYRELFYFFTWRDIKVKYKQTYLGIAWAVLQPLALMVLFTFVFSKNLRFGSGIRYEVFVLSGLILWNLFYAAVSHSAQSIIEQSNIIKKIYFPRLIIPSSAILSALFDFFIAFALFLACCLFFRQAIGLTALLFFPLAVLVLLLAAFGIGTFLSALTIKFRDFRYALPFLLQFLFFASAVLYSPEDVKPPALQLILSFNPVNAAVQLFRQPLGVPLNLLSVGMGFAAAFAFCLAGLIYFRKTEAYFADLA